MAAIGLIALAASVYLDLRARDPQVQEPAHARDPDGRARQQRRRDRRAGAARGRDRRVRAGGLVEGASTARDARLTGLTRVEKALLVVGRALTVLAGITRYATGVSRVLAFVLATLALAGMAWIVVVRHRAGRSAARRRRPPGCHAVDARQPARVLRGDLRAPGRPAGRRRDRDPRLDPRQRSARARAGDRRRRAARRKRDGDHALQPEAAQRHRHAAAGRVVHHRADRAATLGAAIPPATTPRRSRSSAPWRSSSCTPRGCAST